MAAMALLASEFPVNFRHGQTGALRSAGAPTRELAAHGTDRPARTFVLPEPLSRMVAPIRRGYGKSQQDAAPLFSYRLTVLAVGRSTSQRMVPFSMRTRSCIE